MPEDDWVWLKLARLRLAEARFGTPGAEQRPNRLWAERCARDAEQRLQRAWEEGALPLRGVPHRPGAHDSVEIPAWKPATTGWTAPARGYSGAEGLDGLGSWTTIACE